MKNQIKILSVVIALLVMSSCADGSEFKAKSGSGSSTDSTAAAQPQIVDNGYKYRHPEFAKKILDTLIKVDIERSNQRGFIAADKADYKTKTTPRDLAERLDQEYDDMIHRIVTNCYIDHKNHTYKMELTCFEKKQLPTLSHEDSLIIYDEMRNKIFIREKSLEKKAKAKTKVKKENSSKHNPHP